MDLKELLGEAYKEGMTFDEINQALKDKKLVDPATLPPSVDKQLFDKTASEVATLKKQLKDRQSEEEKKQAEQQDFLDKLAALETENKKMKHKEKFLSGGYPAKEASELADALIAGDMDKFVSIQAKHEADKIAALEISIKEKLLKETPDLAGGGKGGQGEKGKDEAFAEALGKQKAEAFKASQSALEYYTGGIK